MKKQYDSELKSKLLKLHLEQGRTIKSLTEEYHLGKGTLTYWLSEYRKECQADPKLQTQASEYSEMLKLKKENAELKKENDFLKKAAAFFAKEVE